MAFLDFIKNRNTPQQQPVAQTQQQPEASPSRSVESLPASVKAQAVEAARPAAQLMDQATTAKQVSQPSMPNTPARGRSLGMER
jgi:hypothetical protein